MHLLDTLIEGVNRVQITLHIIVSFQYNKQHILPLEDVKLQSLDNDGRELASF